jgi:hypothetical protein
LALIDRLLLSTVQARRNGKLTRMTAAEAIMLQLILKLMAGNARAGRALLKYQELTKQSSSQGLELEFVDSDYTRSLSQEAGVANDE